MILARLLRLLTRLGRVQRGVGRVHASVLKLSRGRLRRSRILAGGQPVLALTTTGRRSGQPRATTLAHVRFGTGYAVGALNLGSDHDPAWCLNLRAEPRAIVDVDGHQVRVLAREASGEEADHLWGLFVAQLPAIANSLEIAQREVPIFVLEPIV
jgi:deazaflavin-dependent oxidoreductase (nitroreductase family)